MTAVAVMPHNSLMPRLSAPPAYRDRPDWFADTTAHALLSQVRREAGPLLGRHCGRWGLQICPGPECRTEIVSKGLNRVLTLYLRDGRLDGDLRCLADPLPIRDGSMALVYVQHVLELRADVRTLLSEIARILEPEGVVALQVLNPFGLSRLRWQGAGLVPPTPGSLRHRLTECGLEPGRCRYLGALWTPQAALDTGNRLRRLPDRLRVAYLLEARRRQPGLNPLPLAPPRVALRPGVTAG